MRRRILFLWSRPSGYMASCWRALKARDEWDLRWVAVQQIAGDSSAPDFGQQILAGLDVELITQEAAHDGAAIQNRVREFAPDAIVVGGWMFRGYSQLMRARQWHDVPIILCSDNPYRGDWRQRLGFLKVRSLLRRAALIAVPGQRAAKLMRFWKVPEHKVFTGLYGIDYSRLQPALQRRKSQTHWPRQFLFVGRMDSRKGVDLLLDAYQKYRATTSDPWSLFCIGRGPMESLAAGIPGVQHKSFVAPSDLPAEMESAGAMVLYSRYDAWPLVIVEGAAAGLPIIASDACGSVDELIEHRRTGWIVSANSSDMLATAMHEVDRALESLAQCGTEAQAKAERYSSDNWAKLWSNKLRSIMPESAART